MLNTIHRTLAGVILLFIGVHLANHVIGLIGVSEHIRFMESVRPYYRNPFIEPVLLVALLAQVCLGIYFVYRSRGKRVGFFERAQAFSGCYLAFFLLAHVSATMNARQSLNLDTNIYFAAAGIHTGNLAYYFIPYYFFAVAAVFVHVASAVHWQISKNIDVAIANKTGYLIILLGVILSLLIVLSLSGAFYDISIPTEYSAMFG